MHAKINKRPFFIFIGILLIVILIVIIPVIQHIGSNYRQEQQHDIIQHIWEDEILPYIKDGDIIFRLGDRIWSVFFRDLSENDKKFSHLGIVRIRDDIVTVVHAEGFAGAGKDSVNEIPLGNFLKTARSIGIYRIKNIEGSRISDTAMEYTGFPFDWKFDMTENESLYCSELLYVILRKLNPEIILNTIWQKEIGKYILPLDIYTQEEYFSEIGYWEK